MGRKKFGQKPADGIAIKLSNYDPYIVTSNAREISRNTNLESEDSVELLQSDAIDNVGHLSLPSSDVYYPVCLHSCTWCTKHQYRDKRSEAPYGHAQQ